MAYHTFTPDRYYTSIGWHEPVLHIAPGDSVSTTTVDARGRDASGEQVCERGNPMTGPFYIEGAEPGDALVVTFDKLWPNRDWGWTGRTVAPNVLDPGVVPVVDEPEDMHMITSHYPDGSQSSDPVCRWDVDFEAGTVRLAKPHTRLAGLALPMQPMVGCFGVAPPRGQAISTATSSTFGGNMDYCGFVQGVTVHLPVSAPGALFYLGDGHAVQGDGEIVGTGVEIPFDVTFSVDVIKDAGVEWPRGENETHILTAGNARPLDQCVQHATTEMLHWLERDWGLDSLSAHQLLGQCVEYDMGNVYDPAYTMVCKVRKDLLQQLGLQRG